MISVVIPTYHRDQLLLWHLLELNKQTLDPKKFSVTVVYDGTIPPKEFGSLQDRLTYELQIVCQDQSGPAAARNFGAKMARGNIILFTGDDCIPDRNLLWRHYYEHHRRDGNPSVIQGYTLWHPDIPPTDFMNFLTGDGGLQANWSHLRTENGWKEKATGWFLTTNVSTTRSEFEAEGGFNEEFPNAAWEDVELGYRMQKRGVPTYFCPDAINYHYHAITLDSFANRQMVEGRSRLIFAKYHPEVASGLIIPATLRNTTLDNFKQALNTAKQYDNMPNPDVQAVRKQAWAIAMQLASTEGVRQGIENRGGVWKALYHVHTDEQIRHVVGTAGALERGDPTYAKFEAEWGLRTAKDNWAFHAVDGEVELVLGNKQSAIQAFIRAKELGTGEAWPLDRLKELVE